MTHLSQNAIFDRLTFNDSAVPFYVNSNSKCAESHDFTLSDPALALFLGNETRKIKASETRAGLSSEKIEQWISH